jgi:hypothetical protein
MISDRLPGQTEYRRELFPHCVESGSRRFFIGSQAPQQVARKQREPGRAATALTGLGVLALLSLVAPQSIA